MLVVVTYSYYCYYYYYIPSHKAKVKYVVDENATRCRRCTRLNTECIPHHSKQGQGPRKRRRKEKLPPPNKSRTEETLTSSTMEAAVPGVTGIPNRTAVVGETPACVAATMSSTTTTTMPSSSDRVDVADLSSFSTTEVTISHREVWYRSEGVGWGGGHTPYERKKRRRRRRSERRDTDTTARTKKHARGEWGSKWGIIGVASLWIPHTIHRKQINRKLHPSQK